MWRFRCVLALLGLTTAAMAQDAADRPLLVPNTGGHSARVNRVIFTPDGRQLISVSKDKTIRIWDINAGKSMDVLRPPIGKGVEGALYAAALSPDGKTLAVGGYPPNRWDQGYPIYILSLETRQIKRLLMGHRNVVHDLAFSPDGKRLASASSDGSALIWDAAEGAEPVRRLAGHTKSVNAVAWGPDSQRLATVSFDGTGRIWSVESGESEAVLKGHQREIQCVAWSRDGKSLATGSYDQSICIWEPDGRLRRQFEKLGNHITSITFTPKGGGVLFTRGSADYNDRRCTLLNLSSGKDFSTFNGHSNTVMHGTLSPDGKLAATCGGESNEIYVWNVATAEIVQRLAGRSKAAFSAAWDPSGVIVAWGNTNKNSTLRGEVPIERAFRLKSLTFADAPDKTFGRSQTSRGGLLLEPLDQLTLAIKRADESLETLKLREAHDRVRSFSFVSADRVAVGSSYGLHLYDTTSGKPVRLMEGHADEVWGVAPAPNRRLLLSASVDQTLRVWDTEAIPRSDQLGIGISFSLKEGYPVVDAILPGGPAARDLRIRPKDKIVAIATRGSEFQETQNRTALEIAQLLQGPPGSMVRLRVIHNNQQDPVDYELQRRLIDGSVPSLEPLLSLFVAGDDWVAWSPDGYYAASPGGEKLMGWHVNNGPDRLASFFPLERFAGSLYRPDIIGRLIETGSVERSLALSDLVHGVKSKRTEIVQVLPPRVHITAPAKPLVEIDDDELVVTAEAQMAGTHPIQAMRLMLNGRPYPGENGLQTFAGDGEKAPKATWKVKLSSGRHELAVQAISAVSRNNSEKVVVKCDTGTVAPPGRLFVLAIGISKYPEGIEKLDYADRDADAILNKFRQKAQPAPYARVVPKILKNEQATRKAILEALEAHKKEMSIDDSAIIFFSGHGKRSDKGKLYLLPVDGDPAKLAETAVSAEELKKALDDTRGRNILVILDACHSGAATTEFSDQSSDTVTDGLARDLGRDYDGISVLCSSRGPQTSQEDRENKQGLFTQVLLDGLDGKGRADSDGIVCNHHVLTYVLDTVKLKSKKQQLPTGTPGTMPLTKAR